MFSLFANFLRWKNIKTSLLMVSTITILSVICPSHAEVESIDKLTERWLSVEAQSRLIESDWKQQKPILQQRIALLKAEKAQMEKLLSENKKNATQVDEKRAKLLAEQDTLEQQQASLQQALHLALARIDAIEPRLPPNLADQWRKEDSALGAEPGPSIQLQVALAKLSSLADFNQRVSVNETRMQTPDGREVVVKQLFLGVGMAWFSNIAGDYVGWGKADSEGWQWHFDNETDGQEVNRAIAIFEKRTQADFVQLPAQLSRLSR